jgi:hypothetical protein
MLGIHAHTAELVDLEHAAAFSETFLLEQNRPL